MAASLVVPNNAKKRKGTVEPRKAKYMKKILSDNKATKTTSFKKRMPTLMTKSYQLETLCDVSVCLVCFDANRNVETWPKDKAEAAARIFRYKAAADKEKRESDVIALLKGTKKSLEKKVAACFSDLADRLSGERLDAELKRIEERIELLKSKDQRVVAIDQRRDTDSGLVSSFCGENGSLEDEFYMYLSDICGSSGGELVKLETLGAPIQENPSNAQPVMENGISCSFEDDVFVGLEDIMDPHYTDLVKEYDFGNPVQEFNDSSAFMVHNSCMDLDDTMSEDQRVVATDQRRDTDSGLVSSFCGENGSLEDEFYMYLGDICGSSGGELVKLETLGAPIQENPSNAQPVMENGISCSFADDVFVGLEDIMDPHYTDLVKEYDFGNPVHEFNDSSAFMVHNSCMDLDDTIVGPNPYCNVVEVGTSNFLPVGNSCMKNNSSCRILGDCSTYLDDIVGPSSTFEVCNGFGGVGFGGMGGVLGFGGIC